MFHSLIIEIKNRIFLLGFTWLSVFLIAYGYKSILLFSIIKRNITIDYFITTDVAEVFLTYFKLNISLANYFFLLYCCYHLIIFFISALYYVEYYFLFNIFLMGLLNQIFSVIFVYCIGIPITWEVLVKSQVLISDQIIPIYFEKKLHELLEFYLSFFRFGILSSFLLTCLVFLSIEINKNLIALKNSRNTFHFSFFIISVLVIPSDLLSFLFAGFVFIIIFELCILLSLLRI